MHGHAVRVHAFDLCILMWLYIWTACFTRYSQTLICYHYHTYINVKPCSSGRDGWGIWCKSLSQGRAIYIGSIACMHDVAID